MIVGMSAWVMAFSLHAKAEMAAELDILLDAPKCWELTPEGFEKHFDAIRPELFRWITSDRSRAKLSRALYSNVKIALTAFDRAVPVEEAVVEMLSSAAMEREGRERRFFLPRGQGR